MFRPNEGKNIQTWGWENFLNQRHYESVNNFTQGSFCTPASLAAACLTKGDTFNSTRPNNVFDETFSTTYSGCQRIRS